MTEMHRLFNDNSVRARAWPQLRKLPARNRNVGKKKARCVL
jgi:hypothetical protein